ncbi:MAG: hypothetical protein JW882_04075 [Deltaproteobacteria bacterium]|nr:hypothetical protein [Deltaproteobacteria bacterium]
MRRRTFIKTCLLTMVAFCGFPEKVPWLFENIASAAGRAGRACYPFNGKYSATLVGDQLTMPEAFPRSLFQKRFVLIVPEQNTTVLLVPEASDEWKRLEIMFDKDKRDGLFYLCQSAQITEDGRLCLPEKVRKFAGIKTPELEVTGHGNMIEVHDSFRI